jgi:hypothetical protein
LSLSQHCHLSRLPLSSRPSVSRKKVTAAFDGGRLSSDGGVMLLALAERRLWGRSSTRRTGRCAAAIRLTAAARQCLHRMVGIFHRALPQRLCDRRLPMLGLTARAFSWGTADAAETMAMCLACWPLAEWRDGTVVQVTSPRREGLSHIPLADAIATAPLQQIQMDVAFVIRI